MSGRVLAQVLLRIWGVVLIVWGISATSNVFLFWQTAPAMGRATVVSVVLNVVVDLVAGIYLVRNGDRLGAWLVSDLDEGDALPVSTEGLERVGFGILGIYFLVWGFSGVAANVVSLKSSDAGEMLSTLSTRGGVSAFVRLLAGALLLLRREGLTKAWRALRSQDQEPAD